MKHITKGGPPPELTKWLRPGKRKRGRTWSSLCEAPEVRRAWHEALLDEQGNVCAYCGMRIGVTERDSHIDHIRPRKRYAPGALDHDNVAASCGDPQQSVEKKRRHCGVLKDAEKIPVTPLDPGCEECFAYSETGDITPTTSRGSDDDARRTIEVLGLRIDKLRALRKAAIDEALYMLPADRGWTLRGAMQLISDYESRDRDGSFHPFCAPVVNVLRRYARQLDA